MFGLKSKPKQAWKSITWSEDAIKLEADFFENISNLFQILVTTLTRSEKEGGGIDENLIKPCFDTVFSVILSYQMDLKPKPAFKFTHYNKVIPAWNKQRWLNGFLGSLTEYRRGNNYHTFCLIVQLYLFLNQVMRGNFVRRVYNVGLMYLFWGTVEWFGGNGERLEQHSERICLCRLHTHYNLGNHIRSLSLYTKLALIIDIAL